VIRVCARGWSGIDGTVAAMISDYTVLSRCKVCLIVIFSGVKLLA